MLKKSLELLKSIENEGYEAYIVGGYVRDFYMKKNSSDVDICTNARPRDLMKIFKDAVLPKEKYGAVTINHKNVRYEITTFRKELRYENRRPVEIEYTTELFEDLHRRDFTINSMCMDSNNNIIDLFDGKKDIDKKIVRSLGDARKKFEEDPLRMLRAIRFATVLNFKLDKEVIDAIKINAHLLKNISYARKKEELNKIFASNNVKYGIKLLNYFNLGESLELSNLNKIKYTTDILGIWSMLDATDKYPFTKIEKDVIDSVIKIVKNKTIGKYEIYKYGLYKTSIAAEILGINKKVIVRLQKNLPIKSKDEINISAEEIIKLVNKKPGVWLKKVYDDIEVKIINSKLKNEKDKIIEYILKKY